LEQKLAVVCHCNHQHCLQQECAHTMTREKKALLTLITDQHIAAIVVGLASDNIHTPMSLKSQTSLRAWLQ